ncbi:MAG: hypothetical protein ACK5OB_02105 [Pirellula sp.]
MNRKKLAFATCGISLGVLALATADMSQSGSRFASTAVDGRSQRTNEVQPRSAVAAAVDSRVNTRLSPTARSIRESHSKDVTYTIMRPVRERRTKTVQYTVMTEVRETRTKVDPVSGKSVAYTVLNRVPEKREKEIRYTVTSLVPEQRTKTVTYETTRQEPVERSH